MTTDTPETRTAMSTEDGLRHQLWNDIYDIAPQADAILAAIFKLVPLPVLSWCRANQDAVAALAAGTMVGVPAYQLREIDEAGAPFRQVAGSISIGRHDAGVAAYVDSTVTYRGKKLELTVGEFRALSKALAAVSPPTSGKVSAQHRGFGEHDTPPRGRFQDQPSDEGQGGKP